jgi:cytochrome c oxidase cbb3-type subunit 4
MKGWITVNKIAEYFQTDWAAMTLNDWIGTFLSVGIFLLMVWLYFYVFSRKNKEGFESQRYIPLDEDKFDTEKHYER